MTKAFHTKYLLNENMKHEQDCEKVAFILFFFFSPHIGLDSRS